MKGASNRVGMATLKELMSGDITTSQEGFQMSNFDSVLETCAFIHQSAFLNQNHFGNLYEHTVFYLVRKYMNTMNKIDQPIQFEKPKGLKNDLLKIQNHYKQLEEYITDFDAQIERRRVQYTERVVEYEKFKQQQARQRIEDAVRRARGHEKPKPPTRATLTFDLSSSDDSSDESDADELPRDRQGHPDADDSDSGESESDEPGRQAPRDRPDANESDSESPPIAQKRRRKAPYRFNIASTKGAFYQT